MYPPSCDGYQFSDLRLASLSISMYSEYIDIDNDAFGSTSRLIAVNIYRR